MRIWIAAVGARPRDAFEELAQMYLARIAGYLPKRVAEAPVFRTEEALWEAVERERARTTPLVVLLEERGRQMDSEAFAAWMGRERDGGRQLMIFAVGPADGWPEQNAANSGQRSAVSDQRSQQRSAVSDQRSGERSSGGEVRSGERLLLSLGPMTMAHELARVVICEQVYRALTILAGHPYHRA